MARDIWDWRPHPRQERFFCCPAQVRIAACGRRWGKTECLGIDAATLALAEARAGRECRQLIVAPSDSQARLLGGEVARRLQRAFEDGAISTWGLALVVRQRPALQITLHADLPGGSAAGAKQARALGPAVSQVLCRTAGTDGAGLRGLWAHRIIVDEAGRVPDVVMTEVLMPMLMDIGGDYALASSPFGRRSAFYRLFARGLQAAGEETKTDREPVTFAAFQCPTSDNPHLDHAFLEAQRDELSESMYRQEILAEFVDDFGAVFREEDIAGCLAADPRVRSDGKSLLSEPQAGRVYSAGIDWGRIHDFTVLCVLDTTDAPARLVLMQRWHGGTWEAQLREVAAQIVRFEPQQVTVDSSSIGDPLAESLTAAVRALQQQSGGPDPRPIALSRFKFTADSKQHLVDRLNLALSGRRLTYPSQKTLLTELRGFEYGLPGASGRAPTAARGGGHDDVVMALALAWWNAPEGLPEPPASQVLLGSQIALHRSGVGAIGGNPPGPA
jgi:hypothetical protein